MKLTKHILEAIQRGINLAIDDFDDIDIEAQKVGQIKHSTNTRELIINKYFVDLGLPSGILWAKYNVGVNPNKLNRAQDWYGGYYAWGEIEEKQDYDWTTYKYANDGDYLKLTKYCNNAFYCNSDKGVKPDNLTTLQDEDDVAIQTNKLPWNIKMPTDEQFDELIEHTTNKWIINYQGITGLNGRVFTSKQNGNEIFIPAAGFCTNSSVCGVGSYCYLWSSSLYQFVTFRAYCMYIDQLECYVSANPRCYGFSVRSVLIN